MSDLNIDYSKTNKYLPESLRNFVGATNRISRQNYQEFLTMFSGIELLAVMNNLVAAEYASGYSQFNLTYMRSGVAPRLLDIKVSKTVGKVYYQAKDEKEVNSQFDSFYFSQCLYKAMEQAAQTGRAALVVYGNSDEKVAHLESYNLFRHRVVLGKRKEVIEAHLYMTSIEGATVGYEYNIEEHRFYKRRRLDDGSFEFVPFQEFLVNKCVYDREDKKGAKVYRLDNVPEEIQKQFPDIKFYQERELKGFDSIGVFVINHSSTNKKFPDLNVPEAMFVDAVDNALMLETSVTDREVEKEIGRGQVLIPEMGKGSSYGTYMTQEQAGMLMRSVGTTYKSPIFMSYPTMSMENSKPENIQFDIRTDQWEQAINGDVARLCASVGISVLDYDPRLLQTGQRTDDEINAMTDITANTVTTFRNLNTYEINKCLKCVCGILGLDQEITIRWSIASIINPTKNNELVARQLERGLISRKEALRRINPDLSEGEIERLYKEIMDEIQVQEVNTAFDNF